MYTINLFSKSILSSSFVLMSAAAMAHEGHHMPAEANANMSMTTESVMSQHAQHQAMTTPTQAVPQTSAQHVQQMNHDSTAHTHDHRKEHGAQIYAVTTVDNKWLLNEDGDGSLKSEFETRIGTDENKLFIKVHADKQEAHKAEYDANSPLNVELDSENGGMIVLKRLQAEPIQVAQRLKVSALFGSDTVHTPDTELAYFAAYPRHDNCSLSCRFEPYAFDVQRLDSMTSFDDSPAWFAYLLHAQNFAHWLQSAY